MAIARRGRPPSSRWGPEQAGRRSGRGRRGHHGTPRRSPSRSRRPVGS